MFIVWIPVLIICQSKTCLYTYVHDPSNGIQLSDINFESENTDSLKFQFLKSEFIITVTSHLS